MGSGVTVAVVARDEQRCIARCLDSVAGGGFDDIVVVDTGSVDDTPRIVEAYRDRGVRLLSTPWRDSFARARNAAIDACAPGWIAFLDADEWLPDGAADQLLSRLSRLTGEPADTAFAPTIVDVHSGERIEDVPRIFRTDSGIRFKGLVHEYPAIGETSPVRLKPLGVEFRHDGYAPVVLHAKDKARRNLDLLHMARVMDPENARWPYFMIRNPLSLTENLPIAELCDAIGELTDRPRPTGDRHSAAAYHRAALALACQGLAIRGDWPTVRRYCAELDRIDGDASADASYFRLLFPLLHGKVTADMLDHAITARRAEDTRVTSTLCADGRHLDAVIAALLDRWKDTETADRYRRLCTPWSDLFFDRSRLRTTVLPGA